MIADWSTYLAVQAEVAATLTGLVSLLQLLGVVMVSSNALIPGQTSTALGIEMLVVSSILWFLQSAIHFAYLKQRAGHPIYWLVLRILQTHLSVVPFFVAGILVLCGSPAALYWLAPGFVVSLLSGVMNAWVLLVEILR